MIIENEITICRIYSTYKYIIIYRRLVYNLLYMLNFAYILVKIYTVNLIINRYNTI